MKNKILAILFFLGALTGFSQVKVKGNVQDAETKQPLPGCAIAFSPRNGVASDAFGRFDMEVPSNIKFLIVSFLGYKTDTVFINPSQTTYAIELVPVHELLQEVVVSGVTKTTLIKESPISIVSISRKIIERSNESNIMDALAKNTPGLSMVKTGPNISKPFIRGLGYNRVLTVYDGVRQEGQQWGAEHGIEADGYSIEKAEVIKGPASLVYGSDALAGVVSLLPLMPSGHDGKIRGRVISEYQSNNGLIGNGVRIFYSGSRWSWLANGAYRKAKNYFNSVDGVVYNTSFDEKNLSAMVGYTSAKGFSNLNFTLYDNLQGIPDGSRDSLTRIFTKQVFEGTNDNIKSRPAVSNDELNSYSIADIHQRIQHYRIYLSNQYQVGKGDIHALIAFSQNVRREFNHPTALDQAGTYLQLNTLNYSVRYNAPEFAAIETSFGVNGMKQSNKNLDATNFPIPNYELTDFGVYAYAKWKKNKWIVSGGARLDNRSISSHDFYSRVDPVSGFAKQVFVPDTVGSKREFQGFSQMFTGLSMSAGFTYQFNTKWNLKFNFSRGYRAPSISEMAANGLDAGAHIIYIGNKNFDPEFSWQQDVGVFATDPEFSASASLFNKNIQNFIYLNQLTNLSGQPITDAQGNRTFQYQQSSAQLYGLEATIDWHPTSVKGLTWNNQFALCYGFSRKKEFESQGTLGEYLPFIPPPHLQSAINYEHPLKVGWFSSIHGSLEWDYTAAQNRYLALFNTETATPGYSLISAGVGLDTSSDKRPGWQLQFQVNNLFDVAYQSNLSRLKYFEYYSQSSTGRYGIYSMGRNFCIKLVFTF